MDKAKVIDLMQASAALVKRATEADVRTQKRAEDQAAIDRAIEKAADAIVAHDPRYSPAKRPQVVLALRDPIRVLEYATKLATERPAGTPAAIGKVVSDPERTVSGVIGGTPGVKSAADLAWERKMQEIRNNR